MSFGSRLKDKRKELGITQPQLAKLLGVSQSAIGSWEKDVNSPRATILYDLFKIIHCDANYLFQDETKELHKDTATPEEFENIIKKYRSLDSYGQETINILLDREKARTEDIAEIKSQPNNIVQFTPPLANAERLVKYFRSVSAGSGVFIMGEGDEQIPIPDTLQNCKVDYAIKVSGDSMNPDFHDGDTVLVSHKEELGHGDVGIFIINNNAYIKEYGKEELISRNPEAENIKISEHDNIVCMGKVIGKL